MGQPNKERGAMMNMSITMRIRMLVAVTAVGTVIGTAVFVPGSWNLAEANGPNTISCEANAWPHSLKSGLPAQNDKRNHVGCEDATWEYNSEIGAHTQGRYSSVSSERRFRLRLFSVDDCAINISESSHNQRRISISFLSHCC